MKYHLNGLIEKPIAVQEDETIEGILNKQEEKGYSFQTFPVLDSRGKLVGILSQNDFDFCTELSLRAGDVMTRELLTAKPDTELRAAYELMLKHKKKVLPLIDEGFNLQGMYIWSDLRRIVKGDNTDYNLDAKGQLRVGAAIGVYDDAFERVEKLVHEKVDVVVIDTAHADSKPVIETLRELKKNYDIDVVVGNVSQSESAMNLIKNGADGIKVGQGPGSICTTRIIAGIGSPQVSSVYSCSLLAELEGVPVCADGGIRYSGDITVAIGAGANSVMLGGLLAGTKETPGEIIFWNGRQWKSYRGMGSLGAMEDGQGARERYGQQDSGKRQMIPEGIEGLVPYRGELKDVIFQYVGGLRRGMGYVGAADIEELREKADFVRISSAGQVESHPHDVQITKEAPNYPGK